VRINIPFLPMLVEVRSQPISAKPRWRPLTPFRFSLRGLVLAVAVAGLYLSLCAHLVQLNRASLYHAEQAFQLSLSRYPNRSPFPAGTKPPGKFRVMVPPGATPLELWHREISIEYVAAIKRLFPVVIGLFITFVFLGAVVALGRIIYALFRRSFAPAADEQSLRLRGTLAEEAG
jgi:hypothetical protein